MVLHRLNPGNYVTDRTEPVGSLVVYRYEDPSTGRPDGWMVCRWELTDYGDKDLVSVEWVPTLAVAKHVLWIYTA
jgi:hypothetical protein